MFLTMGVLYKATAINVQSPGWLKLLSFEQFVRQGEICTNATPCYQFLFNETRSPNKYIIILLEI